jgi:hypothetical protein
MFRFEVVMSGSTSTPSFQIEDLLHSYGQALAAKRALELPARRKPAFDSRSLMAGFLAVFVFAPGCAAATVFLMNADERLPSRVMNDQPSPAAKSNRQPLSQWKARAPISPPEIARDMALTSDDLSFLGPVEIRGRLDDKFLATSVTDTSPVEAAVAPRPKRKPEARRARPATVVAEVAVPEPTPTPPPSLLEKLFALRNL